MEVNTKMNTIIIITENVFQKMNVQRFEYFMVMVVHPRMYLGM